MLAKVRNPLWSIAALCIVIEGLREAKSVLLPITISAMLAIICAPAVKWLRRRRVPNAIAVLLVVVALMGLLTGVGALVGTSVVSFRESIPSYLERLEEMTHGLVTWAAGYGIKLNEAQLTQVVEPSSAAKQAMELVGTSMNALATVLSNSFLVILTLVLMLLEGGTVPAKLRMLSGDPHADISVYRRIAQEVQSYLAIKTVLSLFTGVLIGAWATVLDIDFALLWGLLAFLLNYIPNIGSILAAIPACLLALVQVGPGAALALGGGYVVVNTVVGNVIEPMWMGRKLGLSTTVVFLSLVVWGWIWDSVGMLLSVPLTMMLKIMLENSRELSPIAALLDVGEDEAPPSRPSTVPASRGPHTDPSASGPPTLRETDPSPPMKPAREGDARTTLSSIPDRSTPEPSEPPAASSPEPSER